jgi:hypothetical protein
MRIKITDIEKLRAALDSVNGNATTHIASVADILAQATAAEAHLDRLGIAKKSRPGAARLYVSGAAVANAYKWHGRVANRIRLLRGSSGWFVISIERFEVGLAGGWARTLLTVEQRDVALARFQSQFGVLPAPIEPASIAA